MSEIDFDVDDEDDEYDGEFTTCQGCGATGTMSQLNQPHDCYKLPDGTFEEGGTFQ